ncbi:MAG: chromosomal replication initiator protein DnaA [Thermodesulfovibrionales bacterium]|nr:chromosomal replication initiator protein DnaA [Thermodesulfovibrionales bacterium]
MTNQQSNKELWDIIQSEIKDIVSEGVYELWFRPMRILNIKDDVVYLEVPNRFYKEWIEDNYPQLLEEKLSNYLGSKHSIKFRMQEKPDVETKKIDNKKESRRQRLASKGIYLNPKYTFDNFVVGTSNEFAHAASKKVVDEPGTVYNPLFIYGGSGLGKTHLLNAIGNALFDKDPTINIYCKSVNILTNELVSALRHGKTSELLETFSGVDVLLVDDVHFLAGKERTQVEFFHIFNTLYEKQKQIVLTSDRPPLEINDISDRLRSRFNMGLIADINPPDVETKIAILYKKSENEGIKLPEDVAYFIASRVKSNVRDLEGCLIKLGAHSSLTGKKIDIELAKNVLKELISNDDVKLITPDRIQKEVCEYLNVKVTDLKAKKRTKEVAFARQLAMYICKNLTNLSLSEIGKNFGGKDHATVIYACKQVSEKINTDEQFSRIVDTIIRRIKDN